MSDKSGRNAAYTEFRKHQAERTAGRAAYETWARLHAPFACSWEKIPQHSREVWEAVAQSVIHHYIRIPK